MFNFLKSKHKHPQVNPVIPDLLFPDNKRLYHMTHPVSKKNVINHVILVDYLSNKSIHSIEYVSYGNTVMHWFPNELILEIYIDEFDKSKTNIKYQKILATMLGLDYNDRVNGKFAKIVKL